MSRIGYKGSTLAILLNGERIAAVRTKSVVYSRAPIDRSDEEKDGWRYLDPRADSRSRSISVEGVATINNYSLLQAWHGSTYSDISIRHADGTLEEPDAAFLESLTYSGEHDGHVAFEASFLLTDDPGAAPPPPTPNPVPTITSLDPDSAVAGSDALVLTINGTNFIESSVARVDGTDRTTTYVSSTVVQITLSVGDLENVGTLSITVFNPPPGGGLSNALTFEVSELVPVVEIFTESGSWTPPTGVTSVDVLIVAGGGASGAGVGGGGGGGGGVLYVTDVAVTPGVPIDVVVGAGGSADGTGARRNGEDSSFGGLTATGGGAGGGGVSIDGPAGRDGGSGGGGGYASGTQAGPPGKGVPGQGHDGGARAGGGTTTHAGGGGGGAGSVGGDAASRVGGDGGVGVDMSAIFGTEVGENGWFGGGGGGGTRTADGVSGTTQVSGKGGLGGGGDAHDTDPEDGLPNTGGGGGASSNPVASGGGGSGIVIVRYIAAS